jgi:hypothetical protein
VPGSIACGFSHPNRECLRPDARFTAFRDISGRPIQGKIYQYLKLSLFYKTGYSMAITITCDTCSLVTVLLQAGVLEDSSVQVTGQHGLFLRAIATLRHGGHSTMDLFHLFLLSCDGLPWSDSFLNLTFKSEVYAEHPRCLTDSLS